MRTTTPSLPTLLAPVLLALLGLPAAAQKPDAEVLAEIEFARGLAAEWSFVDLAERVVGELTREGVSREMRERLSLVECELYTIGARAERDPARRNQLFERAIDAYRKYLDENPRSRQRTAAEAALVSTSADYAQALQLAMDEAAGEELARMRSRKTEVLEQAVQLTGELVGSLRAVPRDQRSESDKRELYDLMLNRGRMLAEIGKTHEIGTSFFNSAVETLEALVFEAGDKTPPALRAYVAIGDVYAAQQEWEDAAIFYAGVVDLAIPSDPQQWAEASKELTQQQKELRFLFLEIATGGLVEALRNAGEVAEACRYALHYYNVQRREGFDFSPHGYLALLRAARVLLDSGGWVGGSLTAGDAQWYATKEEVDGAHGIRNQTTTVDFALRVAQTVNDANKGNILQVRAQKLISEIITQPGVAVSPDILVQAAEGERNEGNYVQAIRGYERVMRAVDGADQPTRLEYGGKVMGAIGDCYARLGRDLEAAMAYRDAVTVWKDPALNAQNAQRYYDALNRYVRLASSAKEPFEELTREAGELVREFGTASADRVTWQLAERMRTGENRDYEQAIAKYREIPEDSEYYEKAMVYVGRCMNRLGRNEEALQIFDDYLEQYLARPDVATSSPARLARRKEAMATAEFFRGLLIHQRAEEGGEQEDYRKVVELLSGYPGDYPDQSGFTPWVMHMLMDSHLALADLDAARAVLDRQLEMFPEDRWTGIASMDFYKALDAARSEASNPEQRRALLVEMAQRLSASNDVDPTPSFPNLRAESRHWMDLGDWDEAIATLQRLASRFENDPDRAQDLRTFVAPDLGEAYLRKRNTAQAKAVLDPLLAAEQTPSKATVMNWCMSVTGWPEGSAGNTEIIPGAGSTTQEFESAATKLGTLMRSTDSWTCEWYWIELLRAYTYYVWGQTLDSNQMELGAQILRTIATSTDEEFSYVEETCSGEETDEALRARFGGDALRQRYLWLRSKLR